MMSFIHHVWPLLMMAYIGDGDWSQIEYCYLCDLERDHLIILFVHFRVKNALTYCVNVKVKQFNNPCDTGYFSKFMLLPGCL